MQEAEGEDIGMRAGKVVDVIDAAVRAATAFELKESADVQLRKQAEATLAIRLGLRDRDWCAIPAALAHALH